jgi:hypothetical protein
VVCWASMPRAPPPPPPPCVYMVHIHNSILVHAAGSLARELQHGTGCIPRHAMHAHRCTIARPSVPHLLQTQACPKCMQASPCHATAELCSTQLPIMPQHLCLPPTVPSGLSTMWCNNPASTKFLQKRTNCPSQSFFQFAGGPNDKASPLKCLRNTTPTNPSPRELSDTAAPLTVGQTHHWVWRCKAPPANIL